MFIQAKDGIISGDFGLYTFRGSTGSGIFPPLNGQYNHFFCQPKKGEAGILVFEHRGGLRGKLYLVQYWWSTDGKIIVRDRIEKPIRQYLEG